FALAVVALMVISNPALAQNQEATAALRGRVEAFQTAWNAHDAAAVAAFFVDDADQIMGSGAVTKGRSAIEPWWRDQFAAMAKGEKLQLVATDVRMVSPDVGLINTDATTTGRHKSNGEFKSDEHDRGTWVMVRRDNRWLISALRVQQAQKTKAPKSKA